jgi:hypothetical protein
MQAHSDRWRVLKGGRSTHTGTREPLRPFDPQESGWADMIRSDMESWFPTRLPLRFQHSGRRIGGLRGGASLAVVCGVLAAARAAGLLGRRRQGRRRRLAPKSRRGD